MTPPDMLDVRFDLDEVTIRPKNRFLNSLSKNKLWANIEFTTCTTIWRKCLCHQSKMYQPWKTVLKLWFVGTFLKNFAVRCGCVVVKRAVISRKALFRIWVLNSFLFQEKILHNSERGKIVSTLASRGPDNRLYVRIGITHSKWMKSIVNIV